MRIVCEKSSNLWLISAIHVRNFYISSHLNRKNLIFPARDFNISNHLDHKNPISPQGISISISGHLGHKNLTCPQGISIYLAIWVTRDLFPIRNFNISVHLDHKNLIFPLGISIFLALWTTRILFSLKEFSIPLLYVIERVTNLRVASPNLSQGGWVNHVLSGHLVPGWNFPLNPNQNSLELKPEFEWIPCKIP